MKTSRRELLRVGFGGLGVLSLAATARVSAKATAASTKRAEAETRKHREGAPARALRAAMAIDPRAADEVPSTKGSLGG